MSLPPRRVRRIIAPLVLIVAWALTVVLLPVLVVVAAVASIWMPGTWRGVRLLGFAVVGLTVELGAMVAAVYLWLASGFGRRIGTQTHQLRHYAVLRWGLSSIARAAQQLFRLRLETDQVSWSPLHDGVPGSENAMLVLARHAGPGDSLLLMDTLMNRDHLREPRAVMKDTMQLDPVLDTYFHRLPSRFVNPSPAVGTGDDVEATIAALAEDLQEEDALLIFPEGGNFTPTRRLRAIERLRRRGHTSYADRAEQMPNVMPPRPGGVTAALMAAPHADVVFVAHTGLEHIASAREAWRAIPQDKTLRLRWWFYPAAEVPRDEQAQVAWLFERWSDIDSWVAEHQPA